MSQKIKIIFLHSSMMCKYNSAEYNTLPGSSDCEPDKIFGNAGNLFIQSLNFHVNVITDIGKMNDGTVGTLSCISKLYACSVNFSDCCVGPWERKSRMGECNTGRSDCEAGRWDREAGGWDREAGGLDCEAGRWDCEAGGWDCEAGRWDCEAGGWDCEAGGLDCKAGRWDCEAGGLDCEARGWDCEARGLDCEAGGLDCEAGRWDCEARISDRV